MHARLPAQPHTPWRSVVYSPPIRLPTYFVVFWWWIQHGASFEQSFRSNSCSVAAGCAPSRPWRAIRAGQRRTGAGESMPVSQTRPPHAVPLWHLPPGGASPARPPAHATHGHPSVLRAAVRLHRETAPHSSRRRGATGARKMRRPVRSRAQGLEAAAWSRRRRHGQPPLGPFERGPPFSV